MQYFEIEINGEYKRVFAQMLGANLWLHVDGKTYSFESKARRAAGQKVALGDGSVLAPMPGKILKLACSVGQNVAAGQLLVVMEAMKMEYSFAAEFSGTVVTIGCSEGEQVSVSQVLVKVKPGNSK